MKLTDQVREYLRKEGAKGGKKAAKMFTPEQRRERQQGDCCPLGEEKRSSRIAFQPVVARRRALTRVIQ